MSTPTPPRERPTAPGEQVWADASRDYDLGRVAPFEVGVGQNMVVIAVTATFMRAWRNNPLTAKEAALVRTACAQIANDRVHPCLGKRVAAVEPVGSTWIASPSPGVQVTWRAHWSHPEVPVMMTVESTH